MPVHHRGLHCSREVVTSPLRTPAFTALIRLCKLSSSLANSDPRPGVGLGYLTCAVVTHGYKLVSHRVTPVTTSDHPEVTEVHAHTFATPVIPLDNDTHSRTLEYQVSKMALRPKKELHSLSDLKKPNV
ncbi:hypothetical protein J6590_077512 [Homalodisca vitripennis]|nr:hypothetical protein J6590_077512 [Homalodisca vitripennis]